MVMKDLMKTNLVWASLVALLSFADHLRAAEPDGSAFTLIVQAVGEKPASPPEKAPPPKDVATPPQTDAFSQTAPSESAYGNRFHPHMMGDFPGLFSRQRINVFGTTTTTTAITTTTFPPPITIVTQPPPFTVVTQPPPFTIVIPPQEPSQPPQTIVVTPPTVTTVVRPAPVTTTVPQPPVRNTVLTTTTTPTVTQRIILVPITAATGFKMAENASPRPQDRVFVTGNHFNDLRGPFTAANLPITGTTTASSSSPGIETTSSTQVNIPGAPLVTSGFTRETVGFEKTFLGGNASLELRVPFTQLSSDVPGFAVQNTGDLSIVGRFALFDDASTGNLFSTGFVLTLPTGPDVPTIAGNVHPTYVQPWGGYIWNFDRFFVQGIHSVAVPTDTRATTLLFNDFGLYHWLYRGEPERLLSFVVPMAEAHVTTPLDHREETAPIYVPDLVVLTGGVHLGIFRRTTLSLGAATPLTGPRLFNVEGFVQLNWRR